MSTPVADINPPFELAGIAFPPLHERYQREGKCWFREVGLHVGNEGRLLDSFKKNRRAWVARGFSIRSDNNKWIVQQWLVHTPKGYALTDAGEARLKELSGPREKQAEITFAAPLIVLPDLPSGIADKLKPYQVNPAKQIYRALSKGWNEWGYPGAVDFSEVGLGKTYMDLAAAIATGKEIVVLCPLVGEEGWRRAFAHFGIHPRFISTYEAVRGGWRSQVCTMDGHGNFTWQDPNKIVLILDEAQACFPYDTPIETEYGPLPIGFIVETRLDTRVLSFDVANGECRMMPITNWFRNRPSNLITIHHEYGSVTCTPNHKFWAGESGWIEAQNLTTDHSLRILRDSISHFPTNAQILRPGLCRQSEGGEVSRGDQEIWRENESLPQTGERPASANLYSVCGRVQGVELQKTAVLQPEMRRRSPSSNGGDRDQADGCTQGRVVQKDDAKQPDEKGGGPPQDESVFNGKDILSQGRKREVHEATAGFSDCDESTHGACDSHHSGSKNEVPQPAQSLQGGHCGHGGNACHRSGRQHPQAEEMEILGPEENKGVRISRVVGVEILESGGGRQSSQSGGNDPLYDFEVEGTHCYFANGILVHNCRHDDTLTVRCCAAAIRQRIPIIAASATIALSPLEMRFAGRITGLHSGEGDWTRFLQDHGCTQSPQGGWKWDKREVHLLKINAKLFPGRGARVVREDLGDECPETIITTLPLKTAESSRVEQQWGETQDMLDRMRSQMPEGRFKAIERNARMRVWKMAEATLVKPLTEIIREDLDEGFSVAAFLNFNESRIGLSQALNSFAGFYGGQNKEKRKYFEREFQANRLHVLVNNVKAGGASVSLHDIHGERQRKAYICMSDDAIRIAQCLGRVDRVGGKSVSQQFLCYAAGSITERMVANVRAKMRRLARINDGHAMKQPTF